MRLQELKSWVAALAAAAGFAITGCLVVTPTASATDPGDAPSGYGGPVGSCPGNLLSVVPLHSPSGQWLGSNLQIWYSPGNGGTFCAKAFDNLPGSHHMEVVVRRGDWQKWWYDSGTYTTYAGGIEVFGAATKIVYFFGRVTVNGVDYERRCNTLLCPSG